MGGGSLKRLRVRLKASDLESLRETFGANVSENGVFLKSNQLLPVGTPVLLELLYHSGEMALRGQGWVASLSDADVRGMDLELEWSKESEALVRRLAAVDTASTDPFDEVTVLADHELDPDEETTAPGIPVPTKLLGQRPGSNDSWDLVSDLEIPAAAAPPLPQVLEPDEERAAMADAFEDGSSSWADAVAPNMPGEREPGEVTPLARIELVRTPVSEPLRTGDIRPLSVEEDSGPIPLPRADSKMASPSRRIMAVDFGTVNTRAAVAVKDRAPKIIDSRRGTEATPSVVLIRDSGKTIIGEPALRKIPSHPQDCILEARRLIGLPFTAERVQEAKRTAGCKLISGEDGEVAVSVGPYDISFEEIAALLLKEMRECALMALEEKVNRAVLTCPPQFGFRQREALRMAAQLGGLYVERLIAEPLAVAVHSMQDTPRGRIFVYRLGGGTFDATIVDVDADRFTMLASESELFLGGVDFDDAAASLIASELNRVTGLEPRRDPSAMAIVLDAARKAKHLLSQKERATVYVESPARADASFQIEVEVSRSAMEAVWSPLVDRTIDLCERTLESAQLSPRDIDRVVLAGGQARAPMIRERLSGLFGGDPMEVEPERAAVLGAAMIAEHLGTPRELQLVELLGTSLFVAEFDAPLTTALSRGVEMPASAGYTLRSSKKGVELMLGEGISDQAVEAIGVLRLEPFNGTAELRFEVSADGLLSVSALESKTERRLRVELMTDLSATRTERTRNGRTSLEK